MSSGKTVLEPAKSVASKMIADLSCLLMWRENYGDVSRKAQIYTVIGPNNSLFELIVFSRFLDMLA